MLTNNYKNWANSRFIWNGGKSFKCLGVIDINGNPAPFVSGGSYGASHLCLDYTYGAYTLENMFSNYFSSIFIGTGQKEESQEDLALESIIPDSDLKINTANVAYSENKYFFTKMFTYIGANNVIVKEVALYKTVNDGEGTSTSYHPCCFARQLIKPLTVSTGDMFTVTMVIG